MNEKLQYIEDSFTKEGDKVNLEVDNLNVECITSKSGNFSLDSEGNLTVKTINAERDVVLDRLIKEAILESDKRKYPIGKIVIGTENPANFLGFGTWQQLEDVFLLACSNQYVNGSIGGEASVTLGIDNIPSHAHNFSGVTDGNGNHSHTGNTKEVRSFISGQDGSDTARPIASSADHYGLQITNDAGFHQHSFGGTTTPTGSNLPHNNMPPYKAVYMWERVA